MRIHYAMNMDEKFGFDFSLGSHIKIYSLRLVTWVLFKDGLP